VYDHAVPFGQLQAQLLAFEPAAAGPLILIWKRSSVTPRTSMFPSLLPEVPRFLAQGGP
jgi:hypothetical protein